MRDIWANGMGRPLAAFSYKIPIRIFFFSGSIGVVGIKNDSILKWYVMNHRGKRQYRFIYIFVYIPSPVGRFGRWTRFFFRPPRAGGARICFYTSRKFHFFFFFKKYFLIFEFFLPIGTRKIVWLCIMHIKKSFFYIFLFHSNKNPSRLFGHIQTIADQNLFVYRAFNLFSSARGATLWRNNFFLFLSPDKISSGHPIK
jgi:hypothetical protein